MTPGGDDGPNKAGLLRGAIFCLGLRESHVYCKSLSDALVVSQFGLISAVHVLVVSWHTGSEPEFSQEVGKHPNE